MKLLFDENLSPRLVEALSALFPESNHVNSVGLYGRSDREIWDWSLEHGFAIVSKDDDFQQLGFLLGAPPKVIWLSVGNAGTARIVELLAAEHASIAAFGASPDDSVLVLRLRERPH